MEYPQCKINLLPSSGLIILRALAASGGGVDVTCPRGPCGDHQCFPLPAVPAETGIPGACGPEGSSCYRSGSAAQIWGCHRLGCRLGCGGAVPGGEPLVPGAPGGVLPDTTVPAPRPRSRGPLSGPTWDVQVGVPFLQGSPLLQPPGTPGPGLCLSHLLHLLLVGPYLASLLTTRPPVP